MDAFNTKVKFKDLNKMIVFGYDQENDRDVYIRKCETGLACNLVCRFCHSPLSAKNKYSKDRVKAYHFAHKANSGCKKGHEYQIPLMVREILLETKTIFLPEQCGIDGHIYKINSVELHKVEFDRSFNVIADLEDGRKVCIVAYIKSGEIDSRIEYKYILGINLYNYKDTEFIVEDTIRDVLSGQKTISRWIKHKEIDAKKLEIQREHEEALRQQRLVKEEQERIAKEAFLNNCSTLYELFDKNCQNPLRVTNVETNKNYRVTKSNDQYGEIKFNGVLSGKSMSINFHVDNLTVDAGRKIWVLNE